jgi:hypothetical protein
MLLESEHRGSLRLGKLYGEDRNAETAHRVNQGVLAGGTSLGVTRLIEPLLLRSELPHPGFPTVLREIFQSQEIIEWKGADPSDRRPFRTRQESDHHLRRHQVPPLWLGYSQCPTIICVSRHPPPTLSSSCRLVRLPSRRPSRAMAMSSLPQDVYGLPAVRPRT